MATPRPLQAAGRRGRGTTRCLSGVIGRRNATDKRDGGGASASASASVSANVSASDSDSDSGTGGFEGMRRHVAMGMVGDGMGILFRVFERIVRAWGRETRSHSIRHSVGQEKCQVFEIPNEGRIACSRGVMRSEPYRSRRCASPFLSDRHIGFSHSPCHQSATAHQPKGGRRVAPPK